MRRRSPIWTHHGYDGELVREVEGFSLWKIGRLYYHCRGVADVSLFGEYRNDAEAVGKWDQLVDACNRAWGRG